MVKIKGKIKKFGNSYCVGIRKALIDSEVLKKGQVVELELINAVDGVFARDWSFEAFRVGIA